MSRIRERYPAESSAQVLKHLAPACGFLQSRKQTLSFAFYDSDTELAQLRQIALNTLAQPTQQEPPLTNGATVIGEKRKTGRDSVSTKRER